MKDFCESEVSKLFHVKQFEIHHNEKGSKHKNVSRETFSSNRNILSAKLFHVKQFGRQ